MRADPSTTEVIAPNLKRRYSGVTSTVVRLVPVQARSIGIATAGPRLPGDLPRLSLARILTMQRSGPNGPRVWHARRNTEMLAGLALRTFLRKNLKLLFTSAAQRRHTGYTRRLIARMDALVATSDKAASWLDRPAQVIRHGVDAEMFRPPDDRRSLRHALNLPVEGRLVGCFGRLRPQKGTDLLVSALIDTLPRHPDTTAILMGGVTRPFEPFVGGLRAQIAAAGLTERIRILPEDTGFSIARWFQALDLYVAPARWEGFGLTPLEAMACGVPVIATRVGAFEELVADGETGRLVPPDAAALLAEAIDRALGDPETLARWAAACRPRVLDGFRIEDEAAALVALYRALIDGPRGTG